MLPMHKLKEARKGAKVGMEGAAKAIKAHRDTINRLESGDILTNIDILAELYGHRAVLLTDKEYELFSRFMAILGDFGGK